MTGRVTATARPPAESSFVNLRLDEAVALATAWAAHVARLHDIRILVVKGDALARMGLREPRVSADVDVLVEPARFDDYRATIAAAGWRERPLPFISSRVSPHSVTHVAAGWPCDIDVHAYFPGFLEDPVVVFDELWRRRQSMAFAGQRVQVPDRLSSILISALHARRDGVVDSRHAADLEKLASADLSVIERAGLADLAGVTGCDGSLESFLNDVGVDVRPTQSPALREWNARVASRSRGAYPWLLLWQASTWRDRPRIVARAVWPTADDIVFARPEVPRRPFPLALARVRRWGRGLRGLPGSIAALRRRSDTNPSEPV